MRFFCLFRSDAPCKSTRLPMTAQQYAEFLSLHDRLREFGLTIARQPRKVWIRRSEGGALEARVPGHGLLWTRIEGLEPKGYSESVFRLFESARDFVTTVSDSEHVRTFESSNSTSRENDTMAILDGRRKGVSRYFIAPNGKSCPLS